VRADISANRHDLPKLEMVDKAIYEIGIKYKQLLLDTSLANEDDYFELDYRGERNPNDEKIMVEEYQLI
jgi:hypothetical protein